MRAPARGGSMAPTRVQIRRTIFRAVRSIWFGRGIPVRTFILGGGLVFSGGGGFSDSVLHIILKLTIAQIGNIPRKGHISDGGSGKNRKYVCLIDHVFLSNAKLNNHFRNPIKARDMPKRVNAGKSVSKWRIKDFDE